MSDPFIRSQSSRPSLGSTRASKAGAAAGTPTDAQVAEALLRSSGPTGTREKLNNFLSKLETTWQLFNRSSTDSPDGELPKEGRLALLEEGDAPTPETLKMLRARFKEQAQKPDKGAQYLFRTASPDKKDAQQKSANTPDKGPKESPLSDRNTPKPATPRGSTQANLAPSRSPEQKTPVPQETLKQPEGSPKKEHGPETKSRNDSERKFEGPRVERQQGREGAASSNSPRGSVLGRKPGSFQAAETSFAAPKSAKAKPEADAKQSAAGEKGSSPNSLGQRRPQLLRRSAGAQTPAGTPSSRSFLGSTAQGAARLRSSDASGLPGKATTGNSVGARQAVFSQSVAHVSPQLTKRQVSSQMPVHNGFLDECHEDSSGKETGPIRLNWGSGKKITRSVAQRMFAHRARLQLSRGAQGGQGARALGTPISLSSGQAALASARSDVSTRVAGAAIGSLLKDLYEEEDVENLDEETAVTSLGLILRLGGEFTYKHSTRVLDLALELADEVGIRDKQTRKEIKFGTMLRDVGEFDLLLQGSPDSDKRMQEFSGFLAGQDMLRAGLLHDIGKVQIPPEILYKPGKLTPEEYEIIKMHPIYGEEIVARIASLKYLCPTIRGHHERWDGKGYPDGLMGDSIPLAARIISVADVFDALAAERPYKRGMAVEKVIAILAEGRGSHFDPFLVDAFLEVLHRRYPG